jgi:hypothetical protein
MKIQYFYRPLLVILSSFLILLTLAFASQTHAQGSAGVGIIPATFEPAEHLVPGQTTQFSVKVSNLSDIDQTFFLSKRDIVGVQEGGIPIFAEGDFEVTGYELSEWITLSTEELFIPAQASVEVPFTITVPEVASPGSHFGSIIISVEPPKMRTSGASIGYEVANIISLRVAGDAVESARIRQFSTSQYIYGSTNVEFQARIENEGNTLIRPTGPLEVVNMFGKRVAVLNFNESQAGIFPKTPNSNGLKEYTVTWQDESPGFGRYEALLSAVYGGDGNMNTISSTVTFWILPTAIIVPSLIVLAVLFIVIFVSVKLYVRRSMAVASSGVSRRLVRSRQQNQFPTLLVIVSMLAVSALLFIVLLALFA